MDGKEIPLNEFVEKIMSGTVTGAVTSLRGIKDDWKKIEIELEKLLAFEFNFGFYFSEHFLFCFADWANVRWIFAVNNVAALFAVP